MRNEIIARLGLIAVVTILCAWMAFPLSEKIKLGLDLQGGMHLLLEVQAEKAVDYQVGQVAEDVKSTLKDKKLFGAVVSRESGNMITVTAANADQVIEIQRIMADIPSVAEVSAQTSGLHLAYKLTSSEEKRILSGAVHQALETLRNRVDEFGVAEPTIQLQGDRGIIVQLPGISDRDRAKNLIGRTARLEFKLLDEDANIADAMSGVPPIGSELMFERKKDPTTGAETKQPYLIKKKVLLTGDAVTDADVRFDQYSQPYVTITFSPDGGRRFEQLTGENVGKRMAIILDNNIHSAPVIRSKISGGSAVIEGSFTVDEARDLAIVLRAGALPAPVDIVEERSVGPSLGKDSIDNGLMAGIIGSAMVVLFMIGYYRLSGLIAVIGLLLDAVIIAGALGYFRATLTLPGIAGLILTVGMAVDANVLVFERIREELRNGKSVRVAVESGFGRAFWTIFDANLTTLITALVLFQFGTGPIRGFAVTLSIGLLASMFTALFVARTIYMIILSKREIKTLSI